MSSKYVRFKYTENDLSTALNLIKAGQISLNKASLQYGIPKSTLHNKLTKKVPIERKMGPSTILTAEEEQRLTNWILAKAKLGFPMHPEEVRTAVQKVLKACPRENKFVNDKPGEKWLQLFLRRHPEISKRNTEIISKSRASVTENAIRKWFEDLLEFLKTNNLLEMMNDPSRIFNADETGVRTSMQSGLVLAPARKNFRNLYEIAPGNEKESITVLCNYAASGIVVPPMIIFPYKRIPKELALSVPEGWSIGRSDSGWMSSAVFFEYIANVFYPWLIKEGTTFPVILFIDGHKSHYNLELYEFCLEKRIILYCLYPNATHILQPCDVAIFRPLKVEWKLACRAHKQKTTASITRHTFCGLFKEAFERACKPSTIISGFKICGLYPLDMEAVDYSKCISTRRNEVFQKAPVDELSSEDYKSSLKVLEHYFGVNKLTNPDLSNANDDIHSFYKYCKSHAYEQNLCDNSDNTENQLVPIETNTKSPELFTESFLNDLSIEIDGVLYDPNGSIVEVDSYVGTNLESSLFSELDCLELIETILERVFNIVENRVKASEVTCTKSEQSQEITGNQKQINVLSNAAVNTDLNNLWDQHLHWPKQNVPAKKRAARGQMPFAITSKKWLEYHLEQEKKKTDKENDVKRRKMERESKKLAKNSAKVQDSGINVENSDGITKLSSMKKGKRGRQMKVQGQKEKKQQDSTATANVPMVSVVDVETEKDFALGDYVLVLYHGKKYPGAIKDIDRENEEYEISVMEKNNKNYWIWPKTSDQIWYKKKQVIKKIPEPRYDKNLKIFELIE